MVMYITRNRSAEIHLLTTGLFPLYRTSEGSIEVNTQEKIISWATREFVGEINSPIVSSYVNSPDFRSSIYNGLLKRTIASNREYVPDLAASMPIISSNSTVWTFILRPGLQFSDGSDLNASSVVFSYKVALTASINYLAGGLALYFAANDSIWEVDNLTVRFNMSQPYAFAANLYSEWIFSENHFGSKYNACLTDVTLRDCHWDSD